MSVATERQIRDGLQSSMPIGQPAFSPAWYDAIAPWSNARQTNPVHVQEQRTIVEMADQNLINARRDNRGIQNAETNANVARSQLDELVDTCPFCMDDI